MKLHQIKALIAVIDAQSISAAAETLSVSQSALTKTIAQFEDALGVKLLERGGGRRARPTRFGEIVYERGASILANTDEIRQHIDQVKNGYAQVVRIGFGLSVPAMRISKITSVLRSRMPDCALRLRTGLMHDMLKRLRKNEFDFVVSVELDGSEGPDLQLDRLWEDHFVVFMSKHTAALAKEQKDGENMWWVTSDRLGVQGTSIRKPFPGLFSKATFTQIDAYDSTLVKAILLSGPYLSAWPFETFANEVAQGELAYVDQPKLPCRVNLMSVKGAPSSSAVSTARHLIKRMIFD